MSGEQQQRSKRPRLDASSIPAAEKLAAYGEAFMQMFDDYVPEAKPSLHASAGGIQDDDSEEAAESGSDSGANVAAPSARAVDPMDAVFEARRQSGSASGPSSSQRAAPHTGPQRMKAKLDRKEFMSPKASEVHAAKASAGGWRSAPEADEVDTSMGLSTEEFRKLQREVELYGSKALTKKERKKWQASFLERMGAASDKSPRTAAFIGKGMAKKSAERQAKATQEAIETGMLQRKGMGKAKRALKAKQRDRGLMEAGSGFRNGVLFVKKKSPSVKSSMGKAFSGRTKRGGAAGKRELR